MRLLSTYGPGLSGCEDLTGTGWSTSEVTHSHSRPLVCGRQFLSTEQLEGPPNMMAGFPQPKKSWENKADVMILFACSTACKILVPQPGTKPSFPALQGGLSATGPPGKSPTLSLLQHPICQTGQPYSVQEATKPGGETHWGPLWRLATNMNRICHKNNNYYGWRAYSVLNTVPCSLHIS